MDLELGGDVAGDDLGGEAPRGLVLAPVDDRAVDEQGDPFGAAEVEMVSDGGLEPGPGPAGLVEHRGVGDLQLGDGERPVEPGRAVIDGEGVGHDGHHAAEQVADMPGTEAGADATGGLGVLHGP